MNLLLHKTGASQRHVIRISARSRRTRSCCFRKSARTLCAPSFERFLLEGWDAAKSRSRFLAQLILLILLLAPVSLFAQSHFDGARAYEYAREFAAIGPRWPTGPGHTKAEEFLRAHFLQNHDQLEQDTFTADTPIGPVQFSNFIVRFPGRKPGVIVLGTHWETNYWLRNINFVGANDGASTTGLLLAIADRLRAQCAQSRDKKLDGYSVWLVFFDGEEAIQSWSRSDSTYGSRHLAAKWGRDGTLNQIKAFLLADMIGDKDLDIQRETNSTPWLVSLVAQAAKSLGDQRYFFQQSMAVEDDHLPFVERGVPSIDIIDLDYGPNNSYHHTAQDTMDKISAHSLTIDGDVFMESIRLIDQR
jgi:glutaminyl-peptide cyclotransferase